jgi:hypothetical protein
MNNMTHLSPLSISSWKSREVEPKRFDHYAAAALHNGIHLGMTHAEYHCLAM